MHDGECARTNTRAAASSGSRRNQRREQILMLEQGLRKILTAGAFAVCVTLALPAVADEQNERTVLKFSEAVRVPGLTLQPGTYVFQLADLQSDRHTVQVMNEDRTRVLTTISAVPAKRQQATGDTVLKLNPTEGGTPALKAWFYPGTLYGHQFVYPDAEAKDIAHRTKTLVLSADAQGSDMRKGTIHVYDAAGTRTPWTSDTGMSAEWKRWHQDRAAKASAAVAQPGGAESEARVPIVAAGDRGIQVKVEDLEERAGKYIGKVVSVDAEVEDVLGPRMFTIDEHNWGDLDGEVMVYMPTGLVALVREGDRVTITGTPKAYVRADLEREWGWIEPEPEVELELNERAVLVADRIVGGNNDVALVIDSARRGTGPSTPVGTSGSTTRPASSPDPTDLKAVTSGDDRVVGSRVMLKNVAVTGPAKDGGFWVRGPEGVGVFVLPADRSTTIAAGQAVTIDGVVLQMPRSMKDRLNPGTEWNDDVYVYAFDVKR